MAVPVRIIDGNKVSILDADGRLAVLPYGVDYWSEVAKGNISGVAHIEKFGRAVVGTTFTPVCLGGFYRTPQVSGATALRVKAGDIADDAAGAGAQEITLQGIGPTGRPITQAVATAGTSASAATSGSFMRLNRFYVSKSGTYADPNTPIGSHTADIVIENSGGGTDWATMDSTSIARGQSEIACITVPFGLNMRMTNLHITVDSTRQTDVLMFKRANILQTAPPYSAMRLVLSMLAVSAGETITPRFSFPDASDSGGGAASFPSLTDIFFLAKVEGSTGAISISFELELNVNP